MADNDGVSHPSRRPCGPQGEVGAAAARGIGFLDHWSWLMKKLLSLLLMVVALPASAQPLGRPVTSVGLSMPSIFTVTNSPVTSSGTLTATFKTETAAMIFAGPSFGSVAAPPSFRP